MNHCAGQNLVRAKRRDKKPTFSDGLLKQCLYVVLFVITDGILGVGEHGCIPELVHEPG